MSSPLREPTPFAMMVCVRILRHDQGVANV
jgi:hypothetical protein